uniref:Uncharacterized protein n=1 Tax=Leptocylindrus danicus TaxID=163516 RepID=A0A7S2NRU6_9STRA|mmetsp:Transcript_10771/g.16187  ORF Transcript_10771/g.16187 Transcript_10771/m.16187 type:complete len:190 (+) Transcript_10771:1-570(+)
MEEDDIRVIKQLVVEFPAGVAHRDKKGNLPARKIFENADDAATFFNYIDKEMREKRYKAEELVSSFIVEFVQRNDEVDWNFIVTMPTWFQREAVTQKVLQEQLNKNISTRPGTFIVLLDSFLAIAVVFVFRQLSIEVLSGEKQDHTSSNQAKTVFLYLTWFYLFFREAMQIKLLREKDRVIQYFDFSNS